MAIAAKRRAPFSTARRRATEAGPVTFRLKLSRKAARTLKRKLAVRARISFRPSDGGPVTTSRARLVLRRQTRPPDV